MPKICVIILCGIPGTGKTSLARKLVSPFEVGDQTFDSCQTQKNNVSASVKALVLKPPSVVHHVCYDYFIPSNVEQKLITETASVSSHCNISREACMQHSCK